MYCVARGDDGWQVEDNTDEDILQAGFDLEADAITWLNDYIKRNHGDHVKCVYIAEGNQIGYLPGVARAAVGW